MKKEISYPEIIDQILLEKKVSRSWLGKQINASNQSISSYWKRGSFPLHVFEKIQAVLEVNLIEMRAKAQTDIDQKASIAASDTQSEYDPIYTITVSRKEMKAILLHQSQEITQLRNDLEDLRHKFADHLHMSRDKA